MFKIYDGREQFYQWDLNRKLIVNDAEISQVHFCNRTDDCSLVCETYQEEGLTLVNVPNILLQNDWRINVYAYDKYYTKYSNCFNVVKRSKPADYVYTETEVLDYNVLFDRMNTIDKNIGQAVAEYLEENPIGTEIFAAYATKRYVEELIEDIELTPGEKGEPGEKGDKGEPGKDGYTPIKGIDYFDGRNGKNGYTPIKGVDYFDGRDGKDGKDGENGYTPVKGVDYFDGADGYTPVKGVDYFDGAPGKDGANGEDYVLTAADKEEIANLAINLLQVAEEGVF